MNGKQKVAAFVAVLVAGGDLGLWHLGMISWGWALPIIAIDVIAGWVYCQPAPKPIA